MTRHPHLRPTLSLTAAAVAILICLHQRHFTFELAHPSTFYTFLRHRCGDVLFVSCAWALIEMTSFMRRDAHRRAI